jgi:hypothetical protein
MKLRLAKYFHYKQRYGRPQLTDFGEHVWEQTGEKFVKDAKTGRVMERTREVKYLGKSEEGFHLYLGPKSKLKEGDRAVPSFHE